MKKTSITLLLLMGLGATAPACPLGNQKVREGIYDSQFYPNLIADIV